MESHQGHLLQKHEARQAAPLWFQNDLPKLYVPRVHRYEVHETAANQFGHFHLENTVLVTHSKGPVCKSLLLGAS